MNDSAAYSVYKQCKGISANMVLYQHINNIDKLNDDVTDNDINNVYKCLLKFLNLYTSLHIAKDADKFSIVIYLSVIAFKLKYKPFKQAVNYILPLNLMRYLFTKDYIKQSLHLNLADL